MSQCISTPNQLAADNNLPTSKLSFSQLPAEIRLRIWSKTINPRRVVWSAKHDWVEKLLFSDNPAVHVNHEAREEILKAYTFCNLPNVWGRAGVGLHMNSSIDTLCLGDGLTSLEYLLTKQSPILNGLKWLEIDPSGGYLKYKNLLKIRDLYSLELIIIKVVMDPSVEIEGPETVQLHMASSKDTGPSDKFDESVWQPKYNYVNKDFLRNIGPTIRSLRSQLWFGRQADDLNMGCGTADLVVMFPSALAKFQDYWDWAYRNTSVADLLTDQQPDDELWSVLERYFGGKSKDQVRQDGWYIRQVR